MVVVVGFPRQLGHFFAALAAMLTVGSQAPASDDPQRIYADSFLLWIYEDPERDPAPIGYLRAGQSAALKSGKPVTKRGCSGGWFAIEPAGYVCLDRYASLSPTRYVESMQRLAAEPGPYPFEYALSMGTPSYRRVPTPEEWRRRERKYGDAKPRPLPPHWRGHEELVTDRDLPLRARPSFLQGDGSVVHEKERRLVRRKVPFGSMLAITRAFESDGRVFLQSADGTIVPRDRMRLFGRSRFEGIELEHGRQLPLAWPRKTTRRYELAPRSDCQPFPPASNEKQDEPKHLDEECLSPRPSTVSARLPLASSGRQVQIAGTRFIEIVDELSPDAKEELPYWLPTSYLFLARSRTPPASLSAPIESGEAPKWIHFSIGQGTLVAYEGTQPVFATLASPGIGGQPKPGGSSLSDRTTPLGVYRIHFKHRSDDMSPEHGEHRSFWIADVPFAMYFKQPFAIHAAYWHESFGEPMSGGCINVSPQDGKRLFDWTDPQLPPSWYGVGAGQDFGLGTTVAIDR